MTLISKGPPRVGEFIEGSKHAHHINWVWVVLPKKKKRVGVYSGILMALRGLHKLTLFLDEERGERWEGSHAPLDSHPFL